MTMAAAKAYQKRQGKKSPEVPIRYRFSLRAGAALGLAYAMHDRGEKRRDVLLQLREARALAKLARSEGDPDEADMP